MRLRESLPDLLPIPGLILLLTIFIQRAVFGLIKLSETLAFMLIPAQQILAIAPVSPLGPLKKYLSLSPSSKRDGRHN